MVVDAHFASRVRGQGRGAGGSHARLAAAAVLPVDATDDEADAALADALAAVEGGFEQWEPDVVRTARAAARPNARDTAPAAVDWTRDNAAAFGGSVEREQEAAAAALEQAEEELQRLAPGMSEEMVSTVRRLNEALTLTNSKLARSRERQAALVKSSEEDAEELRVLRAEREQAERDAQRAKEEAARAAKARRRQQAMQGGRRRRRQGNELQLGLDADNDDREEVFEHEDERELSWLQVRYLAWRRYLRRLENRFDRYVARRWPFRRATHRIEQKFGVSVSVYFTFSEWMVNTSILSAIFISSIIIVPQIIDLATSGWPSPGASYSTFYVFLGGFLYSSYSTARSVLYSLFALLMLAYNTYIIYGHATRTNRHQVYEVAYETSSKSKIAKALFTSWDLTLAEEAAVSDAKQSAANSLRSLLFQSEWRQRVRDRTQEERRRLLVRRVVVITVHVLLQVGMWVAVVVSTSSAAAIQDLAEQLLSGTSQSIATLVAGFVPNIVLSSCNAVMPSMAAILALQARWDNPQSYRYHAIIGYFFGRMLSLVILLLVYFNTLSSAIDIGSSFTVQIETDGSPTFRCHQDKLATSVLTQIGFEFILPKGFQLGTLLLKHIVFVRIRKRAMPATYFKVEKQAIHLIYLQALGWILAPYFPPGAVVIALLLPLDFVYDRWFLTRFCSKKISSISPAQTAMAFTYFENISYGIFVGGNLGIFIFTTYMSSCDAHGPFTSQQLPPFDVLVSGLGTAFGSVLQTIFSQPLLLMLVLFFSLRFSMRSDALSITREYNEESSSALKLQLYTAQGRLRKVTKQLTYARKRAEVREAGLQQTAVATPRRLAGGGGRGVPAAAPEQILLDESGGEDM